MSDDFVVRARLDAVAAALRGFSLVDRFGIGELIEGEELPSEQKLEAVFFRHRVDLPNSIKPAYLAKNVHSALLDSLVPTARRADLAANLKKLLKLSPGTAMAPAYHDLAVEILNVVMVGTLAFVRKEASQFAGRKRIDILYRNLGAGPFGRLATDHGIRCPLVPVECKNYSVDPENAEFDQLSGRLNEQIGKCGVLLCRTVQNAKAVDERCRSYKAKGEFVIVLADSDLVQLGDEVLHGRMPRVIDRHISRLMLA